MFFVGAAAWIVVGISTGQDQLLYSNIFLGAVDLLGISRWLGRRARISDATQAEEARSEIKAGENLFSLINLDGLPVKMASGEVVARAVDALAGCADGRVDYLIVRAGGIGGLGETLHRLPWSNVELRRGEVRTSLDAIAIAALPIAAA